MSLGGCHDEHGGVVLVAGSEVGALHQQELHRVRAPSYRGSEERRGAIFQPGIYFGSPSYQRADALDLPRPRSSNQVKISLCGHAPENGYLEGLGRVVGRIHKAGLLFQIFVKYRECLALPQDVD
jgi:hypothetical protein